MAEEQLEIKDPVIETINKITEESANIVGEVGKPKNILMLRNGTEYKLPEFNMKKDLIFVQWFGNALKTNKEFLNCFLDIYKTLQGMNFNFEELKKNPEKFLDFVWGLLVGNVPTLLINAPDLLMQLTCIVTTQEEDWVNQNVDLDKALESVFPFILEREQLRNSLKVAVGWFGKIAG